VILVPIIALLVGVVLARLMGGTPLTGSTGQYAAVACLAGLDTICGGIRSGMEGKFHTDVFASGFLSNVVISFFLAYLGDKIGLDLFLAVALVLGARIFTNLSLIRRFLLTKWHDTRERRRLQQLAQAAVTTEIAQ
jgi:small basic protein